MRICIWICKKVQIWGDGILLQMLMSKSVKNTSLKNGPSRRFPRCEMASKYSPPIPDHPTQISISKTFQIGQNRQKSMNNQENWAKKQCFLLWPGGWPRCVRWTAPSTFGPLEFLAAGGGHRHRGGLVTTTATARIGRWQHQWNLGPSISSLLEGLLIPGRFRAY